jgi:hypothetical protein
VTPAFEKEIATSTFSGCSKEKMGRPNSETKFGLMRTMWHPLSIKEGLFTGRLTVGPVSEHIQIKCLDFMWGGVLTDEKLLSEPSE